MLRKHIHPYVLLDDKVTESECVRELRATSPGSRSTAEFTISVADAKPRVSTENTPHNRKARFRDPSQLSDNDRSTVDPRAVEGRNQKLSAQALLSAERLEKDALELGSRERLESYLIFKLIVFHESPQPFKAYHDVS